MTPRCASSPGEIEGEQNLRQLALAVGARAAIVASQHHVGKIDRVLSGRGDVDDARGFAALEHRQQQTRQQEAREIVDGEAQLEAVGAEFAPRAAHADPGVVDEDVEAVAIAPHRLGERADPGERGEIGGEKARLAALGRDSPGHGLAARPVAAVDDDAPALRGHALGDQAPDAVGRTGDENRLGLRRRGRPFGLKARGLSDAWAGRRPAPARPENAWRRLIALPAQRHMGKGRRSHGENRFVFLYHAAMIYNRQLAGAMARLDALTDWERRPRSTMRVGLEPMIDLARRLDDPQKSFRSIHVAGTKGKGSVSALIEAALAQRRP